MEFGDAHALVGVHHLLLDVGEGGGLHEFLALALRGLLRRVGFPFLLGDFAVGLGFHQLDGRCDIADERVDRLHVVGGEGGADVRGGFDLAVAAGVEEIEHGVVLRGVAEIIPHDRLQRVVDFLNARSDRQIEAAAHIRTALSAYDVQAIDTLIGDITPPAELMKTQTDRKIAEEEKKTYETQEAAQRQRQELVKATALANIQQQMVDADQGVRIAELHAQSAIRSASGEAESTKLRALGEAEAIRATGNAKAEAYRAGVEALGGANYTVMQLTQTLADKNIRIVPDVSVTGAQGGNGLLDSMLALLVREKTDGKKAA